MMQELVTIWMVITLQCEELSISHFNSLSRWPFSLNVEVCVDLAFSDVHPRAQGRTSL